jgi:hypothetical protein
LSSNAAVGGGGNSSGTPSSALVGIMKTVSSVALLLDVAACVSVDCGAGVCVVGNRGPMCDCRGTRWTGEFCRASNDSAATAVTTSEGTVTATPTASSSSSSQSTQQGSAGLSGEKQCRSSGVATCSGHGVCERSRSPCPVTSLDCVVSCRSVSHV